MDLNYGEAAIPFLAWARAAGCHDAIDGLGMLVEQAAESFARWHGVRPETDAVYAELRERDARAGHRRLTGSDAYLAWSYRVVPGREARVRGAVPQRWRLGRLFRRDPATWHRVLRDTADVSRYLTIDRWRRGPPTKRSWGWRLLLTRRSTAGATR